MRPQTLNQCLFDSGNYQQCWSSNKPAFDQRLRLPEHVYYYVVIVTSHAFWACLCGDYDVFLSMTWWLWWLCSLEFVHHIWPGINRPRCTGRELSTTNAHYNMATWKMRQRLQQLLECNICMNELEDPRLLSCRHTWCYKCVQDYVEKNNYSDKLPCPVCRHMTDLNQGGVYNLPDFFFMNALKDVIRAGHSDDDDKMNGHKTQETSNAVCSTADCTKPVIKYCTKCQFMCQQCYDDHQSLGITKCHHVIPASEGETFIASQLPPYPPRNHHSHQVMDLFCSTCSVPICVTCSQINHRSHDCIELVKRATVCKTKLEKMCERTNWLIEHVIQAIDKPTGQIQQA